MSGKSGKKRSLKRKGRAPYERKVGALYASYVRGKAARGQVALPKELWALRAMRKGLSSGDLDALQRYTQPLRARLADQAQLEIQARATKAGTPSLLTATPATAADLAEDPTQLVRFAAVEGTEEHLLNALEAASQAIAESTRPSPGSPVLQDPDGLVGRPVACLQTEEHPNGAVYDLETMLPVEDKLGIRASLEAKRAEFDRLGREKALKSDPVGPLSGQEGSADGVFLDL